LFGGRTISGTALGDQWSYELSSSTWKQLPDLPSPLVGARFGHNASYDSGNNRIVVFGGQGDGFFNDVWVYSPAISTWHEITPPGSAPLPRYGAASTLDANGRLVVSHGFTNEGRFDDTWGFGGPAGDAWSDSSPAEGRPIERCLTRGVWDPRSARFLMFGGQTDGDPYLGDTWQLREGAWSELPVKQAPSPRNLFSWVWDGERSRALLFGGRAENGRMSDTWVFDSQADSWSELGAEGARPAARNGHDAVYLPYRGSMIIFGGEDGDGDRNDLWELSLGG
jgi:hypothetical protein